MNTDSEMLGLAFVSFVVGCVIAACILVFGFNARNIELVAKSKKLDCNNIRYIISIDSSATDSLYGKTWRK